MKQRRPRWRAGHSTDTMPDNSGARSWLCAQLNPAHGRSCKFQHGDKIRDAELLSTWCRLGTIPTIADYPVGHMSSAHARLVRCAPTITARDCAHLGSVHCVFKN